MKINNVFTFIFSGGFLNYVDSSRCKIISFDLSSKMNVSKCDVPGKKILNFFIEAKSYIVISEDSIKVVSAETCLLSKSILASYFLVTNRSEDKFIGIEEVDRKYQVGVFSRHEYQRLGQPSSQYLTPVCLIDSLLLAYNKYSLFLFDYSKNEKKWEFSDLNKYCSEEDGGVSGVTVENVRFVKGQVVISLSDFWMLVISVANGSCVWQQKFPRPTVKFEIDEQAGKIYVYNKITHFFILAIESGEILLSKEIRNTWRAQGFDPWLSGFTVADDFIYATGSDIKKIAVINKLTLDIEKLIDIETSEKIPAGYKPEITDKYIFQLDGENTLHIFDKATGKYAESYKNAD